MRPEDSPRSCDSCDHWLCETCDVDLFDDGTVMCLCCFSTCDICHKETTLKWTKEYDCCGAVVCNACSGQHKCRDFCDKCSNNVLETDIVNHDCCEAAVCKSCSRKRHVCLKPMYCADCGKWVQRRGLTECDRCGYDSCRNCNKKHLHVCKAHCCECHTAKPKRYVRKCKRWESARNVYLQDEGTSVGNIKNCHVVIPRGVLKIAISDFSHTHNYYATMDDPPTTTIDILPDDILFCIFMFLDRLGRFVGRNVCKRWVRCMPSPGCPPHPLLDMLRKRLGHSWSTVMTMMEEDMRAGHRQHSEALLGDKHTKNLDPYADPKKMSATFQELAAYGGYEGLLLWLESVGYPPNDDTSLAAALGGHLNMLISLRTKRITPSGACGAAAMAGRLDIAKWMLNNGWNYATDLTLGAVLSGKADMLEWCISRDPPDESVFRAVSMVGDIAMIQQICAESSRTNDSHILEGAASVGRLQVLDWALKKGLEWESSALIKAAKYGQKPVIIWAYEKGFLHDDKNPALIHELVAWSVSRGHVDIGEWLLGKGLCTLQDPVAKKYFGSGLDDEYSALHEAIAACCAMRGCIKGLEWLVTKQCPLGDKSFGLAARNGHLAILDWAKDNGRVVDIRVLAREASRFGKPEVCEWIEKNLVEIYSWAEAFLRDSLAQSKRSAKKTPLGRRMFGSLTQPTIRRRRVLDPRGDPFAVRVFDPVGEAGMGTRERQVPHYRISRHIPRHGPLRRYY